MKVSQVSHEQGLFVAAIVLLQSRQRLQWVEPRQRLIEAMQAQLNEVF